MSMFRIPARNLGVHQGSRSVCSFAVSLVSKNAELHDALMSGIGKYKAERPTARLPPPHLPELPATISEQLDNCFTESQERAELAKDGSRAYAWSVPLLISSQLGRTEKSRTLMDIMSTHLAAESSEKSISPSFQTWMLGRLLLASDQIADMQAARSFEQKLVDGLDDIAMTRSTRSMDDMEKVTDPLEAWSWAYLLLHYAGEDVREHHQWLKASRMTWAAVERAGGLAHDADQHGNRMWINTLALLALSAQHTAGTVLAMDEPLAKASVFEMFEDAELYLRYSHADGSPLANDPIASEVLASRQLSLDNALRQIPSSDFRSWAVGLVQVAIAQARLKKPESKVLEKRFVKAMTKSKNAGDKALGATNWIYAKYVSLWWQTVP